MEDAWREPPENAYEWTVAPHEAPDEPRYVEVQFEQGVPIALDGAEMEPVALVETLSRIGGEHGVGRIDHIEDRLVGIKSREIYEAPAATILLNAHKSLEGMVLTKDQVRFGETVSREYAQLVYDGLWFSQLREDLQSYVDSSQRAVTGAVRVKLHKGHATVVGRKSDYALYQHSLATYDEGDTFDQSASPGFIHLWGLPIRTQARVRPEE